VLLSRRLYPQAANHRLGTLAALHRLPSVGRAHRAQEVDHGLLMALQRGDPRALQRCVARYGRTEAMAP
jgi:hypothetical protein